MTGNLVYTDSCSEELIDSIKNELNLDIVLRLKREDWSVNDTMSIITLPSLTLAVINSIDEISVMEVGLLNFMCKPILITANSIGAYPILERSVDYVDKNANLTSKDSNFVSWYKAIMEGK